MRAGRTECLPKQLNKHKSRMRAGLFGKDVGKFLSGKLRFDTEQVRGRGLKLPLMLNQLRPFLDDLSRGNFRRALTENRVFKSMFRTGYPSTPRNQALIMFNNVFLHLHPVRIRRESLRITYTFCLGGLSFFLFLLLTVTGVLLMFYYRPATAWRTRT